MNKNILLVQPKTGFEMEHANLFMPMGLMSIAAPLVQKGIEVTILDQRLEREKDFFRKLKEYLEKSPVCVGITAMIGTQIIYALEVADFIRKNSNVTIVWGGVHPTLTADQTIRNKFVDIVVRGEGEITFEELINALAAGGALKDIKGITWKEGETIHHNPDREFCDLDKLPRVPYDLVEVERYFVPQVPGSKRCLNVYSARGCPSGCAFCYNTSFNRLRYRKKNIDKVIEEIEWLVKTYNLDAFALNDDNFSVDIERTHYFCRKLIEKKIVPGWKCTGMEICQVEKMDLDLLERSGCKRILMGIESGSEKMLRFLKRRDTLAQIKNVVNKFAGSNIIAHYDFITGFPVEGAAEISETIELIDYIRKTDPNAYCSSFHIFTPFPGTELFRLAVKEYGFTPPDRLEDWYNYRLETVNTPWMSPETKRFYLNLCLITYFTDDRFSDRTRDNLWLKIGKNILISLAKYRWKHRQFEFCPEFRFLDRLINYKIQKKLRGIRKKNIIK